MLSEHDKKAICLEQLTRTEITEICEKTDVAILPLGATEQHGRHLPLGTDSYIVTELAKRVAVKISAIVLPTIPIGYSWVWKKIPGTLTFKESTVEVIIKEIAQSLYESSKIKYLVIFSGHEANRAAMKYSVRDLSEELPELKIIYLFHPGLSQIVNTHMDSSLWNNMVHAAEFETSLMLECNPELVHMDQAKSEYPEVPPDYGTTALSLGDLSASGVYGDATVATKEKGKTFFEIITQQSVEIIQGIVSLGAH